MYIKQTVVDCLYWTVSILFTFLWLNVLLRVMLYGYVHVCLCVFMHGHLNFLHLQHVHQSD